MKITKRVQQNNRKVWTKALVSRKFKQGRGTLFDPDTNKYCCLGVACRVLAHKYRKQPKWQKALLKVLNGEDGVLPPIACKLLNINASGDYNLDINEYARTLASDNDTNKHKFSKIAKTIKSSKTKFIKPVFSKR
jgi:hypothetical protein